MLFGNRLCVFGRHLRIESSLGIHYHNRTERAKSETTGFYNQNVVYSQFFKTLFKLLDNLQRMRRSTACTATYKHLFSVTGVHSEFFRLLAHNLSYFYQVGVFRRNVFKFFDRHLPPPQS